MACSEQLSNEMELCPIRGVNFGQAIIKNDPDAIGRFLADDWIIIDPDGGVIDKSSFLRVIRSGTLSHQVMDSDDVRVRIYGDAAAVTALTPPRANTWDKSSPPKSGRQTCS